MSGTEEEEDEEEEEEEEEDEEDVEEYIYPSDEEEDDEGGAAKPPPPPPAGLERLTSYEALDGAQAKNAMENMVLRVAGETGLTRPGVLILLRYLRWNADELIRRFKLGDLGDAMEAAGVALSSDGEAGNGSGGGEGGAGSSGKDTFTCFVCFEDVAVDRGRALVCNHRFCSECWADGLRVAISSGAPGEQSALGLTCMLPKCRLTVDEPLWRASLGAEDYAKYEHLLALSFVDDNDAATWCPEAGCGNVVCNSVRRRNVACGAGHAFCFRCSEAPHAPCSCDEQRVWAANVEAKEKSGVMSKLDDVKLCPNPECRTKSTRISGCMFLTCPSCKCNWCWQCGDWGSIKGRPAPHHVGTCNKPPDKKWMNDSSNAFANDGRFRFYKEKADGHMQSLEFAEQQKLAAIAMHDEILELLTKLAAESHPFAALSCDGEDSLSSSSSSTSSSSTSFSSSSSAPATWQCVACTYASNPITSFECAMCRKTEASTNAENQAKARAKQQHQHQHQHQQGGGAGGGGGGGGGGVFGIPSGAGAGGASSTAKTSSTWTEPLRYEKGGKGASQLRMFQNRNVLADASDTLARCRRVLAWTFIWAFFERDDRVRALFEMPQSDLARYTEQLSGLIETRSPSFIVANIDKIVSLNGIVSGFLSRMENYERPGGERVVEDEDEEEKGGAVAGGGRQGGGAAEENKKSNEKASGIKSLFQQDL
jgi:hypothetical protein